MSSNSAKSALKAAAKIYEQAVDDAAVASLAAKSIRELEAHFESTVNDLAEKAGGISDTVKKFGEVEGSSAINSVLESLVEQLHDADIAVKSADSKLRDAIEDPQAIEEAIAAAAAAVAAAEESKATARDVTNAKEDLRKAKALQLVSEESKKAGVMEFARAPTQAEIRLAAALESVEKAKRAVNGSKGKISKKITDELAVVKTAVSKAVEKLNSAAADIKKTFDALQKTLRQPTYDVWEPVYKKISNKAKVVDEALASADEKEIEEIREYKKGIDEIKIKARNSYDSAMVMEKLLDAYDFFLKYQAQIYARLEECDRVATKAVSNADMIFFAESLPVINGIIHVGSTREELNEATEWVRKKWEGGVNAQPRIVLQALLFRYVTSEGAKEFLSSNSQAKKATWSRIQERVRRLL